VDIFIKPSESTNEVCLNVSNASTSCANPVVEETGNQEIPDDSMTNAAEPKTPVPSKTRSRKKRKSKSTEFVREGEQTNGQRLAPNKRSCDHVKSSGPGSSPNSFPLKRQTCFNCGIAGHIARNCPHRPYVPYYAQGWENVSKGGSSSRWSSKVQSDGDWNAHKNKRSKTQIHKNKQAEKQMDRPNNLDREKLILQLLSKLLVVKRSKKRTPKARKDKKPDSRDNLTKPNSVRSNTSPGSSSGSHLKSKPNAKGSPVSKSSVEAPTRLNNNLHKATHRWVPKGLVSKLTHTPVVSSILSDKQDMSWEQVKHVDGNGRPSFKMDWVPKTN